MLPNVSYLWIWRDVGICQCFELLIMIIHVSQSYTGHCCLMDVELRAKFEVFNVKNLGWH